MKMILNILALIIVSLNVSGAVYTFKDNTSINATILEGEYEPKESGVILKLNNKFYIHHYPSYHKRIDNGRYESYEPIPAPPTNPYINPPGLPVCTPVRINFIHFSSNTLKTMYSEMHEKIRHDMYKENFDKHELEHDKRVALAVYKAIYSKKYNLNDKYKVIGWEDRVVREFSGNKNVIWGKYVHERHYFSRR